MSQSIRMPGVRSRSARDVLVVLGEIWMVLSSLVVDASLRIFAVRQRMHRLRLSGDAREAGDQDNRDRRRCPGADAGLDVLRD